MKVSKKKKKSVFGPFMAGGMKRVWALPSRSSVIYLLYFFPCSLGVREKKTVLFRLRCKLHGAKNWRMWVPCEGCNGEGKCLVL